MISKILGCVLVMMMSLVSVYSQMSDYDHSYFSSPVGHNIVLAGSFAELRTTHFHAGIDIKPKSKTSVDTISSSADGYVSRIKIQTGGYGRALYVDHPNGYTTVYAHLSKFSDSIEYYIREIQTKAESYSVDIYPDSTAFSITKDDFVGLMGNTGRSYARHLHFEIRETESEIPVNPALFGIKPKDDIAPVVLSLDIHNMSPDFQSYSKKTIYPIHSGNNVYKIGEGKVKIPAWQCGISVQSYDLMNGANNHNGVVYQRMYVDDSLHHSFFLDKVSFDESKYIQSHIDYSTKVKENRTMVKCFTTPGNKLSVYDNITNSGLIKLYEKIPRRIKIVLGDIEGNESTIYFSLLRDSIATSKTASSFNKLISFGQDTIHTMGCSMIFSQDCVDRNMYLDYSVEGDQYFIGNNDQVLFKSAKIEFPINLLDSLSAFTSIGYYEDNEWISLGGKIEGDKMYTYTRKLGTFKKIIDTIPPTIQFTQKKTRFAPGENINVILDDNLKTSGLANEVDYDVYIDGKWTISPYKIMTRTLTIPLSENIEKGMHKIVVRAIDDKGNSSYIEKLISVN